MKSCVFVGPSLHGVHERNVCVEYLPPARRGDLVKAARAGFTRIGLVDGYFGECASTWHKEILFALSEGCAVYGAASMGALRAAECETFGMRPVGAIAWQYVNGTLNDDSEVALLHGPAEIDYAPLTEPMVDVRATVQAMRLSGTISMQEMNAVLAAGSALHFRDRTLEALIRDAVHDLARVDEIVRAFAAERVWAKRADALELISTMAGDESTSNVSHGDRDWRLAGSRSLLVLISEAPY